MNTTTFICRAFTVLGQNFVRQHVSDLIIEIPKTIETLNNGETCVILCRRNGADNIERFRDCLREKGCVAPSVQDAFSYCERTLGWELCVKFDPSHSIELVHNKDCKTITFSDVESLCATFANYGVLATLG